MNYRELRIETEDNEPVEKPPEKKRLRDAKESDLAECVTIDFL
jgi:hypothetical protein